MIQSRLKRRRKRAHYEPLFPYERNGISPCTFYLYLIIFDDIIPAMITTKVITIHREDNNTTLINSTFYVVLDMHICIRQCNNNREAFQLILQPMKTKEKQN